MELSGNNHHNMLTRIRVQGHTTSQGHFLGHIQTIKLHHACLYLPCSTLQCHITFREHLLSLSYQYFRSRSLATSLILNMVEVTLNHCTQRVHLHTVVMTYASRIGTGSEYRTSWYLPYKMHCHCGTNNRASRWTFTDPCKPEVRPGAREDYEFYCILVQGHLFFTNQYC